jgi:hypothetical protein
VAEVDGQFGPEETAPLASGFGDVGGGPLKPKPTLKPDSPATMTSRFEPKDTAAAFAALDSLAKILDADVSGGSVELNGGRARPDGEAPGRATGRNGAHRATSPRQYRLSLRVRAGNLDGGRVNQDG